MDLEQQLRALVDAGFEPRPFDRYPGFLGIVKDGFCALLQPGAGGLAVFGSAGLLLDDQFALLIQRGDTHLFKAKHLEQPASPEQLARYHQFRQELKILIEG